MLRLQKHLVFIERFTDPHEWIAADLDNSNSITVSDLLLLQKLLVFITPEFEFVDSWKFIDSKFIFPPTNILNSNYPESISFTPLTSSYDMADFTGIKMGDIDGSANLNDKNPISINKSTCTDIVVKEEDLKAGETVNLKFKTDNFTDVAAFILEISFDNQKLQYDGFHSSTLTGLEAGNFSEALLTQGYLITNWFSASGLGEQLENNENLFTLTFKVLENSKVSDVVSITNDNLNSEYVSSNVTTTCVELDYEVISSNKFVDSNIFNTYVKPNPFNNRCEIIIENDFNQYSNSNLTIFDVSGRIVFNSPISLKNRINAIPISGEHLNNMPGLYYYKINSRNLTVSGKLIYLNN
ncbi:MAG: T9SS type A sorting domain-containing protein [Saprospiraceae bacterium]|nr:T9SS type A sorting domain-containing protein [Saprospiraceae bacterium]